MKLSYLLFGFVLFFAPSAIADSSWDGLDVIDGPNPTLCCGFYTMPSGQVNMGRYYFIDDGDTLRVRLAEQLLESLEERNTAGDRVCEDDLAASRCSVFCALDASSIEIDGCYRHPRPAMRAARAVHREEYPGDYAHTLRDINNNTSIPDEALIAALAEAYLRLQAEPGSAL